MRYYHVCRECGREDHISGGRDRFLVLLEAAGCGNDPNAFCERLEATAMQTGKPATCMIGLRKFRVKE